VRMKKADKTEEPETVGVGVSVRLPAVLLAEIDRIAQDERRNRANVIRILLEDALEARGK
jgi:metal-responsive CopG/Arc/MetJ family transcriptional regulator